MKSSEVKRILKARFAIEGLRVDTTPTNARWITAWVSRPVILNGTAWAPDAPAPFPVAFRQRCIRTAYPASPGLWTQERAGNIEPWSISLLDWQWDEVFAALIPRKGNDAEEPICAPDAWRHGFNAVAARPPQAPRNPWDEDRQPALYEAWEEGAEEAGINSLYYNGVLKK